MIYTERAENVYLIDTKMFGFDKYNAAYIVEGKEIALIDTGLPNQTKALYAGIKRHGFSVDEISYIFITHEHSDHCGNIAPLLRKNPKAKVYINPIASDNLTNPSAMAASRKRFVMPEMAARFGEMEPVSPSRIEYLNDGDVFDLGNGEKLRIIFTPGHQPGSIVILEEKNMGLFIGDLPGNYFADADCRLILTPPGFDLKQSMESLSRLMDIPVTKLFLGHFGICDKPKDVMQGALDNMKQLLNIAVQCMEDGKPEEIEPRFLASRVEYEKKLRIARGEALYKYTTEELNVGHTKGFLDYVFKSAAKALKI